MIYIYMHIYIYNAICKATRPSEAARPWPVSSVPFRAPNVLSTDAQHALNIQVPNNHILAQNQFYNCHYQYSKYLIIGYMDP